MRIAVGLALANAAAAVSVGNFRTGPAGAAAAAAQLSVVAEAVAATELATAVARCRQLGEDQIEMGEDDAVVWVLVFCFYKMRFGWEMMATLIYLVAGGAADAVKNTPQRRSMVVATTTSFGTVAAIAGAAIADAGLHLAKEQHLPKWAEHLHQRADQQAELDDDDWRQVHELASEVHGVLPRRTNRTHRASKEALDESVWEDDRASWL